MNGITTKAGIGKVLNEIGELSFRHIAEPSYTMECIDYYMDNGYFRSSYRVPNGNIQIFTYLTNSPYYKSDSTNTTADTPFDTLNITNAPLSLYPITDCPKLTSVSAPQLDQIHDHVSAHCENLETILCGTPVSCTARPIHRHPILLSQTISGVTFKIWKTIRTTRANIHSVTVSWRLRENF